MTRLLTFGKGCVLVLFFFLIWPRPVLAYIDPQSGSYILQLVLGVALAGITMLKIFWKQSWGFLQRIFRRGKSEDFDN